VRACRGGELFGATSKALLYEIEAALRASDDSACLAVLALAAERRFETKSPADCYRGEVLWLLHLAHAAARSAHAPSLLQEAARWVREVTRERARADPSRATDRGGASNGPVTPTADSIPRASGVAQDGSPGGLHHADRC
jgi:hypothetical protein